MASGNTVTDSLADSIPTMIASARIVREFAGVMPNLVDRQRLDENTGTVWNEVAMSKLSAQAVSENTELDNPQQMEDTLFSVTPTVIGVHTVITDRVALRISANAYAQTGSLAQNAIERKKDQDGLTAIDGATTALGGANALDSGEVAAAAYRITSNTTEPAPANAPLPIFKAPPPVAIRPDLLLPSFTHETAPPAPPVKFAIFPPVAVPPVPPTSVCVAILVGADP